jgi:hypothetical protein
MFAASMFSGSCLNSFSTVSNRLCGVKAGTLTLIASQVPSEARKDLIPHAEPISIARTLAISLLAPF